MNLNLFAGGYTGGTVAGNRFINDYVGSTSIFAGPTSIPNFNTNLGLPNYYSSQPNLSGGISSYLAAPTLSTIGSLSSGIGSLTNSGPPSAGTFDLTLPNLSGEIFQQSQLPKGSTTNYFYDSIGTRVVAGQTPSGQVYYFDPSTGSRDFRELQAISSEGGGNYQVFAKPGTRITLFDEPGTFTLAVDAIATVTGLKGAKTAGQVGKFVVREFAETARDELFQYVTGLPYVFNFAKPRNKAAAADLQPYSGPGGGHHVPAKSAFTGAKGYDASTALAIPNRELARLGVDHFAVTGAQKTGYGAFAKTGKTLTWNAVKKIETQALVTGGMNASAAQTTVQQAITALKDAGIQGPTRIPWGQ